MDRRKPIAEPPLEKRDCKLICMIGLPGCGKTTWIREFIKQNPEDLWNVLGTDQLLDQMHVFGQSRKKDYPGRWDVLIGMAYKCLLKLLQIACRRQRNYIVDQTNVFPEARRRKMVPFREFHRSAVVIVPNEKDYHQRCLRQSIEEGKAIPPEAIMEMKGGALAY